MGHEQKVLYWGRLKGQTHILHCITQNATPKTQHPCETSHSLIHFLPVNCGCIFLSCRLWHIWTWLECSNHLNTRVHTFLKSQGCAYIYESANTQLGNWVVGNLAMCEKCPNRNHTSSRYVIWGSPLILSFPFRWIDPALLTRTRKGNDLVINVIILLSRLQNPDWSLIRTVFLLSQFMRSLCAFLSPPQLHCKNETWVIKISPSCSTTSNIQVPRVLGVSLQ